jgi:hypothetical protein
MKTGRRRQIFYKIMTYRRRWRVEGDNIGLLGVGGREGGGGALEHPRYAPYLTAASESSFPCEARTELTKMRSDRIQSADLDMITNCVGEPEPNLYIAFWSQSRNCELRLRLILLSKT